jgi:DNA-binding CsgD family transcriptional regulator
MPGIHDEDILRWLLSLYRAAQEMPQPGFKDEVFQRLKALIPLSSLVWTNALSRPDGGIEYLGMHLFQEPDDLADELPMVNRQHQAIVAAALARPGEAHSFHPYGSIEHAAYRDYIRRYGHHNVLLLADSPLPRKESFSLYRSRSEDHFTPAEQRLLGILAPHMTEAFAISRRLSGMAAVERGSSLAGTRAIIQTNGMMVTCGEQFLTLLQQHWPGWYSGRVPPDLLQVLRPGTQTLPTPQGTIVLHTRRLGPCLFVQAGCASGARLARREAEVAGLYARGSTHRQIAQQLGVARVTVRNTLQKVYAKLQVGNKAELVQALRRQPPATAVSNAA